MSESFYILNFNNFHSTDCLVKIRFQKGLLLVKLKEMVSSKKYSSFDILWSALFTLFPSWSEYRKFAYKQFWKLTNTNPKDYQITAKSLHSYSINLKEITSGFFCLNGKVSNSSFHCIYTTTGLLNSIGNFENFCTDGTYKLTWLKYVVILFGGITFEGKFHLITISITKTESIKSYSFIFSSIIHYCSENSINFTPKAIVSDGALSIKASIDSNFIGVIHINCWAHVARNIFKKIPNTNKQIKQQFYSDLNYLQRATTERIFKKGLAVLITKYREHDFF